VRIDIPIYDGFDELDAIAPLEVFANARAGGADLECRLVARQGKGTVTASHGLRLQPDATYTPGADLLVVPGGGWVGRQEAGSWGEVQRGDWLPLIAAAAADGTTMSSVCTGAMVLAHAGVIGTRRATTHHGAWADLEATGATLVTDRVVDDGDLVTAGGVTSGIDLALWLVERFFSAALADAVAAEMETDRFRPTR
jgi:transcriptional regulator GlxA family with amidase domain